MSTHADAWHADAAILDRYAADRLTRAGQAAVEGHFTVRAVEQVLRLHSGAAFRSISICVRSHQPAGTQWRRQVDPVAPTRHRYAADHRHDFRCGT